MMRMDVSRVPYAEIERLAHQAKNEAVGMVKIGGRVFLEFSSNPRV